MAGEDSFESTTSWQVLSPPPDKNCPSTLSRFFAQRIDCPSPEARTDATLADVVDSALRSLHQVSQRHKPSAQLLSEGFAPASRQEMLVWLVQAFDVMHFSDNLLFDTALLLDRYYASQPPPEDGVGGAQRKLLAAVCTSLKTGAPVEPMQLPLRQVVTHLGRDQVPFDAVLVAELAMLRQLKFRVATPTAKDFLEALTTRLSPDMVATASNSLADFLLQLTLMDAALHYRHPHAILAASALVLALYTTRAPASSYAVVLEDLALHCSDAVNHQCTLVQCIGTLHALWVQSVQAGPTQQTYARVLCGKFARQSFHSASSVAPPQFPPNTVPPSQGWGLPSAASPPHRLTASQLSPPQDEFDEAIALLHQCMNSEDSRWSAVLSDRMRGLAESSWKVRWVLSRHGWGGGRFRVPPDREYLLRDLMKSQKNRTEKASPEHAAASCTTQGRSTDAARTLAQGGRLSSTGNGFGPRSGSSSGILGSQHSSHPELRHPGSSGNSGGIELQHSHSSTEALRSQRRPRRAASWCGQRSSGRATCLATRSPSGARGVRPPRTSSRSP